MPAPVAATYSAAALVAAQTSFLVLVDAGVAVGGGFVRIRSEADVLLAEIPLTDPAGTVNGTTGQLTLTASALELSAPATGVATYGEICDSDGTVLLSLPVMVSEVPQSGRLVLNTVYIEATATVELISATIG